MANWIAQRILEAIAAGPPSGMRQDQVAARTGLEVRQLDNAMRVLCRREFIDRAEGAHFVGWRLTATGRALLAAGKRLTSGPRGPMTGQRIRTGTLRERVWRAIRIRRKFSAVDLIPLVALGTERDVPSNVGKYLRALTRAGYLHVLPRRAPGQALASNGHLRYLLILDTGPLAPVWRQSAGAVFDPNDERTTALADLPRGGR